jgi:membrane protease YdiL (CAAX protease family)
MNEQVLFHRRALVALAAAMPAAAACATTTADAAAPSLAGSWTLVAADRQLPDGSVERDYGAAPRGRLMIDEVGFGSFRDSAAITRIESELGWRVGPAAFTPLFVLLVATAGLIPGLARALGEEIGWRGFLLPRLVRRIGFTRGALVTGLIWTAWHVPLLIFGDYHSAAPRWFALGCFTVMVVSLSFVLAWLRLKSGSVWPCALLHACHNIMIQVVFTPLTLDHRAITAYATDEFGFAVPMVVFILAVFVWKTQRQPNRPTPVTAFGQRFIAPTQAHERHF